MLGSTSDVMILDVAEGQIQAVSSIANPDKLRHLGPVADLRALVRKRSNWIHRPRHSKLDTVAALLSVSRLAPDG